MTAPAPTLPGRAPAGSGFFAYENRMVAITSLTVGAIAFDRLAIGYLAPYLVRAFGLTNTQLGALYAVQALAAALFGLLAGRLADLRGWRKRLMAPCLCATALLAILSSTARSYLVLAPARFLLGAAEGPVATLGQSVTSLQSSPHRRGLNLGVMTLTMVFISQVAGPIVLTRVAERWSWRAALQVPAVPALLLAVAVWLVLRDAPRPDPGPAGAAAPAAPDPPAALRSNVWVCAALGMVFMTWLVIHSTFLPLYLVKVRGMSPGQMAVVMSLLGVAGGLGSLIYPAISDRLGRKPAMLAAMGSAIAPPLALVLFRGPDVVLTAILVAGWLSVGALALFSAVIPGESIPPRQAATVIAMIMAGAELVGGVAGPLLAGSVADRFGLVTPFWFTTGAAVACCLLACMLKESRVRAPAR